MSEYLEYTGSQARTFRSIIESTPVAIQILGADGLFIDCNAMTIKMFGGTSKDDIIGHPPSILSPPTQSDGICSNDSAMAHIKKALTGITITFDWVHQRITGEAFPARVLLNPLDYNGSPSIMATVIDLTHERSLVEKVKKHADAMKNLIKVSPVPIIITDPEFNIRIGNDAALSLVGYSRNELIMKKITDFEVVEQTGAPIHIISTQKTESSASEVIRFPSGLRVVKRTGTPVLDESGIITQVIFSYMDLTQQIDQYEEVKTLIREGPYGIVTFDSDLRITDVNPAFEYVTGYSHEEALTLSLHSTKIVESSGGSITDAVKTKKPVSGKIVLDLPAGIKYLDYTYIPILNRNGEVTQIFEMFADQTSLVDQFHESETLINESPVSILTIEPDGTIIKTNPTFVQMSGIPEETLHNMNLCDLAIVTQEGKSFDEVLTSSTPVQGRLTLNFSGDERILDYTYLPVKDVNGHIRKILLVYIDMTSQVMLGEEMADKAAWYESILDALPLAVSVTDLDMYLTFLNKKAEEISGFERAKKIGWPWKNWVSPEENLNGSPLSQFKEGTCTLQVLHNGKNYQAQCAYVHNADGNNVGMMEVLTDITAMKRVSDYLEQSVQMVAEDIRRLAAGRVDLRVETLETDEYTQNASKYFVKINKALQIARMSLSMLVEDSTYLAASAVEGYLKVRADPNIHKGEFRRVIEGINATLDSIVEPINEGMRVAGEYASCNFSARVDPHLLFDEDWAEYKESLNNIGVQVTQALLKVSDEMHNLTVNSDSASSNVQEIAGAAAQLVKNVQQVSENAKEGSEGISRLHQVVDDFVVTVADVSSKTEQISILTRSSNDLAKEGTTLARNTETGMQVITASAHELKKVIAEIQQEMGRIGKIVKLISDIASQTNLLALNAAIEAARAGEAGRGFAVVASEVKSLATESRRSAESISELISTLQKKSEIAAKAVVQAETSVNEGNTTLQDTLRVFSQLAESVAEISSYMEQVASMSEEQAASVQEITMQAEEVAHLIEGTADKALDSANVTEKTAVELEEVTLKINMVREITQQVSDAVASFRVEG
jgi:PAS domain S-box-containing protein